MFYDFLNYLTGLDQTALTIWHMAWRILIVYAQCIIFARINKRFMGVQTVFDFTINILIGSILASGIVGAAPFLPIIGITTLVIIVDLALTILVSKSIFFEKLIKGSEIILVENGKINWPNMNRCFITLDDLMTALHEKSNSEDIASVKKAFFENNGSITIILR